MGDETDLVGRCPRPPCVGTFFIRRAANVGGAAVCDVCYLESEETRLSTFFGAAWTAPLYLSGIGDRRR